MTRKWIVAVLMAVGLTGATAVVFGYRHSDVLGRQAASATPRENAREVAYYRHPGGQSDFSPVPKQDEQGRDYIAVYQDEEPSVQPAGKPAEPAARKPGKILYYRHPMGLPDVSTVPKKDAMGMAYVPVYEGEQPDDGGVVRISPGRVQLLGVRTEEAQPRNLVRHVRAAGTVQLNERRVSVVAPKFEGWIERLRVNATGTLVRRGEPLMDVYAPELVQAQHEYLAASGRLASLGAMDAGTRAVGDRLAEAALQRLRNLDIGSEDLAALRKSGVPQRRVTLRAPSSGVVLEKKAVQGMRFMAGEMLYQIADLSTVWVLAEVFEQDLALIRLGQEVTVTATAYPGRVFPGRVAFVHPTMTPETRTVRVRIEIRNPDGALKPGMYAAVDVTAPLGSGQALAVPDSAVLDSGLRQVVLVDRGEGRFQPRAVRLGASADGYVEVLDGLAAGERVVAAANFLIDAESNLKAALQGFTAAQTDAAKGAR